MATAAPASKPFLLKVDGKWVNVESWAKIHPGGSEPLERYRGLDATEAFYIIHGSDALAMLEKMKAITNVPPEYEEESKKITTPATLAFRKFRAQLEKDGWFEREWIWDFFYFSVVVLLIVSGILAVRWWDQQILASVLIGLALQQAGWLGHDYVHGRGKISYILGRSYTVVNGFSTSWWSNKHNTHHVHTNQMGVDLDIANDPILHLWIPSPDKEFPFRKYQHLYYHFVYSFLYVSWRMQSIIYSWEHKIYSELFVMGLNYAWMFAFLPLKVVVLSIIIGGWFVAEVVTATHQSEEILDSVSYNFVEDQFKTTRDVTIESPFLNWFWGGMQYQLEHHLFPTIPKYKYGKLTKLVAKWAKENGIEYKTSSPIEILKMNYNTMKVNSQPPKND